MDLVLDGNELGGKTIPLVDDRREHFVECRVGGGDGNSKSQKYLAATQQA
jgi:hypothetical protein